MVVSAAPASAEFFGCNDHPGQFLYSCNGTPGAYIRHERRYSTPRHYRRGYSHDYSASWRHRRHATYYGSARYWNGR